MWQPCIDSRNVQVRTFPVADEDCDEDAFLQLHALRFDVGGIDAHEVSVVHKHQGTLVEDCVDALYRLFAQLVVLWDAGRVHPVAVTTKRASNSFVPFM